MSKQIIHTDAAPAAVGPYSQAVAVSGGKTVICPVRSAWSPAPAIWCPELRRPGPPGVRQHAGSHQAAGGTLDNVVKLTLFLTDLGKFAAANAIMAEIIPQPFPARSTIGVASLPKGAQFEVEAILVL